METKNEKLIQDLHERLIKEFTQQISESIKTIQPHQLESLSHPKNESHRTDNNSTSTPVIYAVPPPQEPYPGPDKINEIRNKVTANQTVVTSEETLNPDKQKELMEIITKRSEEFGVELKRVDSLDDHAIEAAKEKFNKDLMDNTQKQLKEKSFAFAA